MADAIQKAKLKNPYVDWKNRPFATNASAEERRRQSERFSALSEFIRKHGGFVTSPPGKVLRVEVMKGSVLPAKLAELGYNVVSHGSVSRVVGIDRVSPTDEFYNGTPSPFAEYAVFEIRLDGR